MNVKTLFALSFSLLFCTNTKVYIKNIETLHEKKIPILIVNDATDNKKSSGIFMEQENALIFIFKNIESAKIEKTDVFTWHILDIRNKPWYYPYFLYKRKFKEFPLLILDLSGGFIDFFQLPSNNYKMNIERGVIKSIEILN